MESGIFQQIFDQLAKANKVLIVLPASLTPDNTASALGLSLFLQKMRKSADIVSAGEVPAALDFLPQPGSIKKAPQSGSSMVISVDVSRKPVDEVSYEPQGSRLNIFLKSKTENYVPADVMFSSDKTPYQVIVVLDCASLEDLGGLFEREAETLFAAPKINIDNKPGNEYFGAINLVDINASSVSEILTDLLAAYERQLIDEDIATCLLTGIITKTNSFRHAQTTPKAFLKASELVELGGRQQEVVRHLYKTKPLQMLRLWGRALARLKTSGSVLYSMLGQEDYKRAEATDADSLPVLRELHENTSGYNIVALLSEQAQGGVKFILALHPQIEAGKIAASLNIKLLPLNDLGGFKVYETALENTRLLEAEEKFVATVK